MSKASNHTPDNMKKAMETDVSIKTKASSASSPADTIHFDFELHPVKHRSRKKNQKEIDEDKSPKAVMPAIAYEYRDSIAAFSSLMCYLLEYMKQIGNDSAKSIQTNLAEMYHVFINMIFEAKSNKKKNDAEAVLHFSTTNNPSPVDVILPIVDEDQLRSILQYREAAIAAPKILAESMIQQIVNAWENLLGSLLGTRIDANTLKNNANVQMTFSEIAKCKDIAEIKQRFTGKVLRKFLGGNIDKQLASLNSDYKIDLPSALGSEHLKDLKAIIELRHAIVHCNSIATSEYCEKIRKLGKQAPEVGAPLLLSGQELLHAWDVFFSAGMIVSLLFQVHHARQLKSSKMEDAAFSDFVTESHSALEHNRNEAARIMLQYANKLSIHFEWPRLATKINLALAYKRMGYIQECRLVLGECDWNACDDQFKAAVAALLDNNKEALKLLCKLCRKSDRYLRAAHSWVVFENVRRDKAFETEMHKILSKKGKQMVQVLAPAVHFSKEKDAQFMLAKLYEVALKFQNDQL